MSSIKLSPNASGTGIFTIAAPNSNTDRTLTLPDQTGTVLTTSADAFNIGSNQLVKDASGNVGIGTGSPATKLDVSGPASVTSFTGTTKLGVTVRGSTAATDYSGIDLIGNNQTNPVARIAVLTTGSGSSLSFGTSNSYGSGITNTAATIDPSGNLLVGTSSATTGETKLILSTNSGTTNWRVGPWATVATNFYISPNSATSGVYLNGTSATSWSALSDERYKEGLEPIESGLAKTCTLRAVTGYLKGDETRTKKTFLIAQEVQAVLPEAVDSSNPDRLGLSYTDTIPLLVAAIKELKAEVDALKAQLGAQP